jgi:hypothetical protein
MQTRYRAAATALLLTATAGLAATGGAAEASGTHAARAQAKLTVTITSSKSGLTLSTTKFRPGRTTFKLERGSHGRGLVQVLRLRKGYSQAAANRDFGKAFGPTSDVHAVRRIDKNVVFYGGMSTPAKGAPANRWAVDIDHTGTYLVVNLDQQTVSTFRAKGTHQRRSWPSPDGRLNIARGNVWKPGSTNPNRGWMNTTNNATEPHFVELMHVKNGTTVDDVMNALNGGPDPSAADHASTGTGIISPGHAFRWKYSLPKGEYASMCFFPSKTNGMPHAMMGMVAVFPLG